MITPIFLGIYSCLSIWILVEDCKTRSLPVILIISFGLLPVFFYLFIEKFDWLYIVFNVMFLGILYGLSALGLRLGGKRSIVQSLGMGDVLFMLIVSVYFETFDFILWLNIGLLFSLLVHWIVGYLSPADKKANLIPLAGYLSVIFTVALYTDLYFGSISARFIVSY